MSEMLVIGQAISLLEKAKTDIQEALRTGDDAALKDALENVVLVMANTPSSVIENRAIRIVSDRFPELAEQMRMAVSQTKSPPRAGGNGSY